MSCPICQKPPADSYRPFCCKRCANLDLARWLSGTYTVPINSVDEEDPLESMTQGTEALGQ